MQDLSVFCPWVVKDGLLQISPDNGCPLSRRKVSGSRLLDFEEYHQMGVIEGKEKKEGREG